MGKDRKPSKKKNTMTGALVILLFLAFLALGLGTFAEEELEMTREEQIRAAELEELRIRTTPPTLTLSGKEKVKVKFGKKYKEPGFTAVSAAGDDLTGRVQVTMPEMEVSGTYEVLYQVTDDNGNTTRASRTIKYVMPMQTEEGANRGLSILMYHDVYDPEDPEAVPNANKVSTTELTEQLDYLISEGYYYPTWDEVRKYIDGKIDLPEKSVVLTFDDASKGFVKHGAPILEEKPVRATSFVITERKGQKMVDKQYEHIELQSHSNDMHMPGGRVGHGGIFTALPEEDALADLEKSIRILGNDDAFAYPFGDYTAECEAIVEKAGFKVAVTTQYGKVYPGQDPYALPRMRVNGGNSLEDYKTLL